MGSRNALDGYYDFKPASDLDVFLSLLPEALRTELLENQNATFDDKKKQSYLELLGFIFAKQPGAIREEYLLYSLVQAIKAEDCNVNQAASILLFYTFLKFCVENSESGDLSKVIVKLDDTSGNLDTLTITDMGILQKYDGAQKRLVDPNILSVSSIYEENGETKFGTTKYTAPSFTYRGTEKLEGFKIIPIMGGPYRYPQARYAIENDGRFVSLPTHLTPAVLATHHFSEMTEADGKEDMPPVYLISHDLFHAVQEIDVRWQKDMRLELLDFIAKNMQSFAIGTPARKNLAALFNQIHDSGVGGGTFQQINISTQLDTPTKAKLVAKLLELQNKHYFSKLKQHDYEYLQQLCKKYKSISTAVFGYLVNGYTTHHGLFGLTAPERMLSIPEIRALRELQKQKSARNETTVLGAEISAALQNYPNRHRLFESRLEQPISATAGATGTDEVIIKLAAAFNYF